MRSLLLTATVALAWAGPAWAQQNYLPGRTYRVGPVVITDIDYPPPAAGGFLRPVLQPSVGVVPLPPRNAPYIVPGVKVPVGVKRMPYADEKVDKVMPGALEQAPAPVPVPVAPVGKPLPPPASILARWDGGEPLPVVLVAKWWASPRNLWDDKSRYWLHVGGSPQPPSYPAALPGWVIGTTDGREFFYTAAGRLFLRVF